MLERKKPGSAGSASTPTKDNTTPNTSRKRKLPTSSTKSGTVSVSTNSKKQKGGNRNSKNVVSSNKQPTQAVTNTEDSFYTSNIYIYIFI